MPRGREIENSEVIEIYAGQLGAVLGRLEAEEKLYSKTAEYETVFHGTQSALFLIEVAHEESGVVFRYSRNNRTHQETTGISAKQIRGKTPVELVGEELGQALEARYQECYRARESISYEETLELPGGKRTWLITLTPHFGRDCTVTHLVGSSEDITRRKEVEKNLQQKEEQLRQVTDNMLDMICKTDLNGTIEYASPSYNQLLGFQEEIVGKNVLDFVLEDDYEKVAITMQKAISEQSAGRIDFRMKTADGGYIWVESIGNLLYTDGQLSGAVFTTRDITDRKEAEEALLESEAKIATTLRAAKNIAFITTDSDPENPRILEFSPGAEAIFGYQKEEVIGKPVNILHQPEDVEQFPRTMEQLHKHKSGFSGESVLIRKNGERFPALFTTHPIFNQAGELTGTLGVSIDISERKKAEKALQEKSEELERYFENSLDLLIIASTEGEFVRVNHS